VEKELKKKLKAEKKPKKIKLSWKASLSEKEHAKIVEKTREYIFAGDITQAVLSIRFQAELSKNAPKNKIDPLRLYRSVRQVNPSPYMFILKFGDKSLVGASPETMVRLEEGEMTLRPIAGTRPRGKNQAEDRALEKELLADEKERAEHIMLVDLGRNDLGRVAEAGTVHPDELMTVERYSHVMHIVSNVRAKLAAGKDAFDLLRATFPAGTLSGSPKIRAMGIIEELEPVRRGFYGGCVGYFGFSGNMDMAITIRSAFLERGKITVQSGGGIVADSVPAAEYQEVMNKSKAMRKAIELCC
jgi:anthranilate synthase component 1